MTKKGKKALIITSGILVGLATAGFLVWKKIKPLLNFKVTVKDVKFNSLTFTNLDMNISMNFLNKSKLTIVVNRQEYDVFLNGIFLTTLKSNKLQVVEPLTSTTLAVNVNVNPKELLKKIPNKLNVITHFKKQELKLVTKLWIKFGLFSIPVTIPYEAKIEDWGK